jgi:hypothetical protein
MWNEEMPQHWKESIIAPLYIRGYKNDCSNYRRISLLPTTNKTLSINILLSMLTPYIDKITFVSSVWILM